MTSGTRIRQVPSSLFREHVGVRSVRGPPFSLHPRPCLRRSRVTTGLILLLGKGPAIACLLDSTYAAVSEPHTSLPPASLLTEVVPPVELAAVHEVPSNILAPTFTPVSSRISCAEVTKSPAKSDTKHDFNDLIVVLGELSANGNSRPRFWTVSSLLRNRKPDVFESAGVTQFKAYLQLAETAGIVAVEQHQGEDGWITLSHQRNTNPNNSPQRAPSQRAEARFRDLIQFLNGFRDPEPRFSTVGPRLLRDNPSIYRNAGVTRFEEYIEAAVEAGVVTVRGVENGDGWLKLCLTYCNPPAHPLTLASTVSTPPTRVVDTASPFGPLVDFLKFKQSVNAQAIPFSDIFTHFVATLGYPDLASLYTSVPGVTTFSQYINAAITSGLVLLVSGTVASGDALVSYRGSKVSLGVGPRLPVPVNPKAAAENLAIEPGASFMPPILKLPEPPSQEIPPLPAQPSASSTLLPSHPPREVTVSQPAANIAPGSFGDLVAVLTQLQAETGKTEFRFTTIATLLLKKRPNAYASVGATRFTDYINLAMKKGVVKIRPGTQIGDGWVSLGDPKPGGSKLASAVSLQSSK